MARFYGHLDKTRAAFEGMQPILDETEEKIALIPKTALNMFDYMRLSIDAVGNSLQTLFVASIQNGESFTKNLMNMLKALTVKLLAAAAAAAILAALITVITGGTGFALTAGGPLLSGSALVGGLFKGIMGIPQMAEGGIVTGPTLAMVGEGGGPEAVIPLDRLNSFAGGNINVTGRIQGQDILLSQERASRIRSRYRGF
jgi:phage-related minor tail protein